MFIRKKTIRTNPRFLAIWILARSIWCCNCLFSFNSSFSLERRIASLALAWSETSSTCWSWFRRVSTSHSSSLIRDTFCTVSNSEYYDFINTTHSCTYCMSQYTHIFVGELTLTHLYSELVISPPVQGSICLQCCDSPFKFVCYWSGLLFPPVR